MLISRWIDSFTGQQRMVEDLTKRIVARCEQEVWARIQSAVSMDPAESRGYIRARAASIINREVATATESVEDATDSLVERVRRSASDAIVRKMASAIATQHPSQQQPLRRAA